MIRAATRRPLSRQQRIYATNQARFRSGLEEKIAGQLKAAGVPVLYETFKVPYVRPQTKHTYLPDLLLPNGIVVELKGLFDTDDRRKHKLIKEQHPDLDLRFVFSNAHARIAKKSPTTYAKWCDAQGIPWAHKEVPIEWLTADLNPKSLAVAKRLGAPL